jgi:osmoprotectant transport system permease protein
LTDIMLLTVQHLQITLSGVFIAVVIGVITGIVITRHKTIAGIIMTITDVIQTIPSMALLAILMMVFGLGDTTVIIALFLYSLLPVMRNTFAGLISVDKSLLEAGSGMGMTKLQILVKVTLPLALPIILSGIRVALVTALGIATMGVLIGSGGLGTFIYRGLQMANIRLILSGAIPLSILAIGIDILLGYSERKMFRFKRNEK